ncbi:DNA mismatch repair protein MutS, partial [bacterium]|nr:DNA mismatch repair protein MutS [bacterium]
MTTVASGDTPMLRQYREIKAQYPDAILFFRLGDFYEMFMEDASVAARELELTLTGRGKDDNRVPMCGIPYHAVDVYLPRLVRRGYKVAICEQVEAASAGKGLTRREVVKVVTPGTVILESLLAESENNYLAAVLPVKLGFGISFLDISTGEFRIARVSDRTQLDIQIQRLAPSELLIPEGLELNSHPELVTNRVNFETPERAERLLTEHFNAVSLSGMGVSEFVDVLPAAWAVMEYARYTQKNMIPQVARIQPHRFDDVVMIDRTTMVNLELITARDPMTKKSTLFSVLDHTKTAMGARKLKGLIQEPISNIRRLDARLDAVAALVGDLLAREEIRSVLNAVYDIERLTARIVSGTNNPRDCLALKESVTAMFQLAAILQHLPGRVMARQAR